LGAWGWAQRAASAAGRRVFALLAALHLERGLELGGELVATRIGPSSESAPGHAP
jgi:hypothetical protein